MTHAIFYKLVFWACSVSCGPTWQATYNTEAACLPHAAQYSHEHGVIAACIPYRVKISKGE